MEENIEEDELDQYERCDECEVMPGSKYECNSIMHYSVSTMAKDKDEAKSGARPTMESRNEELCPTEQLKWDTSLLNISVYIYKYIHIYCTYISGIFLLIVFL